ncbi:MAG TPA: abortive infection family protein [Methylomirabilota bacterium]|nr:abortive infection family protein [Methylomirabilota bacterium]
MLAVHQARVRDVSGPQRVSLGGIPSPARNLGAWRPPEGLGSLRNRLSDSHGRGKAGPKPASRHAELAVNLAGAVATFLMATWKERTEAST